MPSVQRAHRELKDKNIRVVTISIDAGGARDVAPFLAEHGYTMPALLDSNMDLFRKLGLVGTPGTFVVDRSGLIVARGFGPVSFDHSDFRKYVMSLSS